jgi:hypothetical protein
VAEAVVHLGLRVEGASRAEAHLVSEPFLRLLVEIGEIENAWFEGGWGREEFDEIVALTRLYLGCGTSGDFGEVDVIDTYGDTDFLTPLLRERVEPLVVARDEMAPLQDLEVAGEFDGR